LKQQESWENNGVLDAISHWSATTNRTLLWIGGRSGDKEPWITVFSLDLIRAVRLSDVNVAYVLCNKPLTGPHTPTHVLKLLIFQMLAQNPSLVFQVPEVFNKSIFRRAITFSRLWHILETAFSHVAYTLLVIDRIEEFEDDASAELLPHLSRLAKRSSKVNIIVTSIFVPPDALALDNSCTSLWIDTKVRPHRRAL